MSKSIFNKLLVCIMFIIVASTSICLPVSNALGDIFSAGKDFLNEGNSIGDTINTTVLEDTSAYIYNTLLGIAIMVAIIVAMVLGIQFMAASADEKAKVKEAILPFAVGCVVVFGAFTIWKIAVNIGNNAENSVETTKKVDWSSVTSAQEFIDKGGNLDDVPLETLKDWESKLRTINTSSEYYKKVKEAYEKKLKNN